MDKNTKQSASCSVGCYPVDKALLKERLTAEQFRVTQEEGTEAPFNNPYWNQKEPGIYLDVVSGEPLFSSLDKFDSGTGWPSYTSPLLTSNVHYVVDQSLFSTRVEVRSKGANSHLGHVFEDGPGPYGLRYCINSAALQFVPQKELINKGLQNWLPLFQGRDEKAPTGEWYRFENLLPDWELMTVAGGCFWGVEDLMQALEGVVSTRVGYCGGTTPAPKYSEVKLGRSGHAESVQIIFDHTKTTYETLLKLFFKLHDPTTLNRQGNDVGTQYRSAVFCHSQTQRESVKQVISEIEKSALWKDPIRTEVTDFSHFWPAEIYHQKYLIKNPGGYTCHFFRE